MHCIPTYNVMHRLSELLSMGINIIYMNFTDKDISSVHNVDSAVQKSKPRRSKRAKGTVLL